MSNASIAYLTAVHPLGIRPDYYRIGRRCKSYAGPYCLDHRAGRGVIGLAEMAGPV
jgi:hypothetical protein